MASPLEILQAQAQGINTCAPATTIQAAVPTPVIVQQNQVGCYSGCAIPPTPASVPLQANLGEKCGDLNICIRNTGTAPLTLVFGGTASSLGGFSEDNNTADVLTAYTEATLGNVPVNASPAAVSCEPGIASGFNTNAPKIQYLNGVFALDPVILKGFVVGRVRKVASDGADNVATQQGNSITAWEADPFDGQVIDFCTRTMDVNFCSPCVGDNTATAPVTFQEDCVTHVGPLNGFSYQIEPNTQLTLQACFVGIADIRQYRDCSLPTFSNGVAAAY